MLNFLVYLKKVENKLQKYNKNKKPLLKNKANLIK